MSAENYYELFGVPQTASNDEIKKGYIQKQNELLSQLSPNEDQLKQYASAYLTLIDPIKRRRYDYNLKNADQSILSISDESNHFLTHFIAKMNRMNKEINDAFEYFNEKPQSFEHEPNSKHFSKHYDSISYIDSNGNRRAKTIETVNRNGQIFKKESRLENGKWETVKYLPDGTQKNKTYDDVPKNKTPRYSELSSIEGSPKKKQPRKKEYRIQREIKQ